MAAYDFGIKKSARPERSPDFMLRNIRHNLKFSCGEVTHPPDLRHNKTRSPGVLIRDHMKWNKVAIYKSFSPK